MNCVDRRYVFFMRVAVSGRCMKLFERRGATGAQTRSACVTSDEYVLLYMDISYVRRSIDSGRNRI